MFPFLNSNGYIGPPFAYNMNYDSLRGSHIEANPYYYSFLTSNFPINHESSIPMHLAQPQMPYLVDRNSPFDHKLDSQPKKKKKITKKLRLVEVKKKIRLLNAEFKVKRKAFKFFDPSRAPPITTLRNSQELEMDLKFQQKKTSYQCSNYQKSNFQHQRAQNKLQILSQQPNTIHYPFLICKKRRYHRNLKRRYSVAYFEQRATFIMNRQPIPASLHPKNKVRKPRVSKNNAYQASEFSEQQVSEEFFSDNEESNKMMNKSQNVKECQVKLESNGSIKENEIKQENYSDSFSK